MTNRHIELNHSNYEALRSVMITASNLKNMAYALGTVSNGTMFSKLMDMSRDLMEAADTIRANHAESVNLRVKEAEQASANMLSAALSSVIKRAD